LDEWVAALGFEVKVPDIVDTGYLSTLIASAQTGKHLLACREIISLRGLTRTWKRVNGVKWSVRRTAFEDDAVIGMERAGTFAFVNEYGYEGRDPEIVHAKVASRSFLSFIP
jgi:hypothetical protein